VHGDIRAQNVSVAGKVFGNITASESIELLEGSAVRGNIAHKSINVEPGATLHGQLIGGESAPVEPAANQDEGPEATA
jgi:cytoskeletal protein CcmA (bactofilin family)